MNLDNHPCFSLEARHKFGRIHLPVAPACNMQCKYCNRKMDCINESRPGVTSVILTPVQALSYLDSVMAKIENISVVGIAGPGDPFANPYETLETMSLVRKKYPDMNLCVATNGIDLAEHAARLAELNTGHVTVTVNAIDPEIGSRIYDWARYAKKVYRGMDAAKIIIERQTEAVMKLKENNVTVKINTVVIPGINDDHVGAISERMKSLGADVQNCIALYHVEGTEFENLAPMEQARMIEVRRSAGAHMTQMSHCARCRSDAVGMLGTLNSVEMNDLLVHHSKTFISDERPFIAAASMEGILVNQHLGEAAAIWVYGLKDSVVELIDRRSTPIPGSGDGRWEKMGALLDDCGVLLVSGVGKNPGMILEHSGLHVIVMEGLIQDAADRLFNGAGLPKIMLRPAGQCGIGKGCTGSGMGC
jgi:nitrogen fixation protein NifB